MRKLFFAVAALVVLASCSKQKDQVGSAPSATKKLISTTYVFDNGTPEVRTISYDSKGRLSVNEESDRRYEFDYQSPNLLMIVCRKKTDNSIYQRIEGTLNDKGAVTQLLYKDLAGVVTYTYEFAYDAAGNMTVQKGFTPSGNGFEEKFEYVNGEAVSSKTWYDGVLYDKRTYTYGTTKNKGPFGIGTLWPSDKLFGNTLIHYRAEYKNINKDGILSWHTTYTQELDADGYLLKETTQNMLTGKKGVLTFVYE